MSHQSPIPILGNALLTISKYRRFELSIGTQETPGLGSAKGDKFGSLGF